MAENQSEAKSNDSLVLESWVKSFGIGCDQGQQQDEPFNDDFESEVATKWWNKVKDYALEREIVIFLPCAKARQSGKVIQDSMTHRAFAKAITRWCNSTVQRIIVSEPLTIIPYEMRDYPPYNYPPPLLILNNPQRRKDYNLFVSRLQSWLEKQKNSHVWIWFGTSRGFHHPRILQAAWTLDQPLFTVIPRGGTRDIGYSAHCLRFMIEEIMEWKTTDQPDDPRLKFERVRYFILSSNDRKRFPTPADIEKHEVSPANFLNELALQMPIVLKRADNA